MIYTATRGKAFQETFTFKSQKGKQITPPAGKYDLTLVRGNFVKLFPNLDRGAAGVHWAMSPQTTQELEYSTLYFTLTFNGQEIARGVLRVE